MFYLLIIFGVLVRKSLSNIGSQITPAFSYKKTYCTGAASGPTNNAYKILYLLALPLDL